MVRKISLNGQFLYADFRTNRLKSTETVRLRKISPQENRSKSLYICCVRNRKLKLNFSKTIQEPYITINSKNEKSKKDEFEIWNSISPIFFSPMKSFWVWVLTIVSILLFWSMFIWKSGSNNFVLQKIAYWHAYFCPYLEF